MQGALALIKAQAALAGGRPAHHQVFGHLDDDVWFSVNTTAYRRHATLRKILPSLFTVTDLVLGLAKLGAELAFGRLTSSLISFGVMAVLMVISMRQNKRIGMK